VEKEWAIFELDVDYLRAFYFPRLLAKHIGVSNTGLLSRVEIRARSLPKSIIFETGDKSFAGTEPSIVIPLNHPNYGRSCPAHRCRAWSEMDQSRDENR